MGEVSMVEVARMFYSTCRLFCCLMLGCNRAAYLAYPVLFAILKKYLVHTDKTGPGIEICPIRLC